MRPSIPLSPPSSLGGSSADEPERPPLELVRILRRKGLRSADVSWLANHSVVLTGDRTERILQVEA